ncbi:MAG: peptidoglycan-binding protein, partial [Pyrinomonadaceae bacterium]
IQNKIKATGLIQFLIPTAKGLGTTVDELKNMTSVKQLEFVEKYFKGFKGKVGTLEAVYTAILSGSPKKPDDVLFKIGTPAYKMNPLDWNQDGKITAAEATTIVGARLFGGVETVQNRLLELAVVPLNLQDGFADGRWGGNTSKVLGEFQKSKGLAQTGLMNEETGFALFPESKDKEKSVVLKKDDKGDDVKKLQESLVKLGYLTMDKIGGGFGKFGPMTETAVKAFQTDLNLKDSGKVDEVEQTAISAIISGIAKGSSQTEIVKAIQDHLVILGFMTQLQVNTGHGTFGNQTETAVKNFQKANLLQESGIVEAVNFKVLFNQIEIEQTDAEKDFSVAKDGENYTVLSNILMTKSLQKKVEKVANLYFAAKNTKLVVTSGYRPPERQAPAMFDKIVNEGEGTVRKLYKNKVAINEIITSYTANKKDREKAIAAMTDTINKQVSRGVFISNHLLSNAVDIRKTANAAALSNAVIKAGGRVVIESNHFHLELH